MTIRSQISVIKPWTDFRNHICLKFYDPQLSQHSMQKKRSIVIVRALHVYRLPKNVLSKIRNAHKPKTLCVDPMLRELQIYTMYASKYFSRIFSRCYRCCAMYRSGNVDTSCKTRQSDFESGAMMHVVVAVPLNPHPILVRKSLWVSYDEFGWMVCLGTDVPFL